MLLLKALVKSLLFLKTLKKILFNSILFSTNIILSTSETKSILLLKRARV